VGPSLESSVNSAQASPAPRRIEIGA